MASKITNLSVAARAQERVYGLTIQANTIDHAQALYRTIVSKAGDQDSEQRPYDVSIRRTSITIWADTPASVEKLLKTHEIDVSSCTLSQHVRFKTEPALMEPVMWVDFDATSTDSLSIVELLLELRGEVIAHRHIDGDRRRFRAQAPLSELFDLKSRLRGLCDAEVNFEMGFSHYLRL